jgi:hypothetical protein
VQEKLKSWLTLSFVTKIRMQKILVILRLYWNPITLVLIWKVLSIETSFQVTPLFLKSYHFCVSSNTFWNFLKIPLVLKELKWLQHAIQRIILLQILPVLTELIALPGANPQVTAGSLLCLGELCQNLKAHAIPSLPLFMPRLIQVLKNYDQLARYVMTRRPDGLK